MPGTMSVLDMNSDSDFDTVSDCDADADAEDLREVFINILGHVSGGETLQSPYQNLLDGYHARYVACPCTTPAPGLSPVEADAYHLKLITAVLQFYYGPDYIFVFIPTVPSLEEEPTVAQMSAMFPDERVPYLVQDRFMRDGIVEQLPRPVSLDNLE